MYEYDRKMAIKGGIKLKMRIYRRLSAMRPTKLAPAPPHAARRLRRFAQSSKNVTRDVTRPCARRNLSILRLTYFGVKYIFPYIGNDRF